MGPSTDDGDQAQRRHFSRIHFQSRATLSGEGRSLPCTLIDLSLRGALVDCADAGHSISDQVLLDLDLDGSHHIRIEGEVSHRQGDRIGISCTGIDIDSMTHLRRIVELNTGDGALLNRELAALLASH
ncbi:MAG TPA: PilZ domain-containing protein [Rhodocyclaceae bacterium]